MASSENKFPPPLPAAFFFSKQAGRLVAEARSPAKVDQASQEEITCEPIKNGASSSPPAVPSSRNTFLPKATPESPSKSSRASSRPSSRPMSRNPSKEEINEEENGYYGDGIDGPTQTVSQCGCAFFSLPKNRLLENDELTFVCCAECQKYEKLLGSRDKGRSERIY